MPDQELDPDGLVNFDSPFFDLASVYGRGPDLDSQFYESDGRHMRIMRTTEGVEDLPRWMTARPCSATPATTRT